MVQHHLMLCSWTTHFLVLRHCASHRGTRTSSIRVVCCKICCCFDWRIVIVISSHTPVTLYPIFLCFPSLFQDTNFNLASSIGRDGQSFSVLVSLCQLVKPSNPITSFNSGNTDEPWHKECGEVGFLLFKTKRAIIFLAFLEGRATVQLTLGNYTFHYHKTKKDKSL